MRVLLQRTINAPEDFTFGAAEKETTIRELREEIRIVRARMENNPEVKRYAGRSLVGFVWLNTHANFLPNAHAFRRDAKKISPE